MMGLQRTSECSDDVAISQKGRHREKKIRRNLSLFRAAIAKIQNSNCGNKVTFVFVLILPVRTITNKLMEYLGDSGH